MVFRWFASTVAVMSAIWKAKVSTCPFSSRTLLTDTSAQMR